tara:strand:- start:55 stop:276 length:222 start_codon:yes stop_codon:yes gene_type:complete
MAKYIHGRTDNAIKNHWNSALRRGRNIEHLLDQNGALPTQFPQGLPEQPARNWVAQVAPERAARSLRWAWRAW